MGVGLIEPVMFQSTLGYESRENARARRGPTAPYSFNPLSATRAERTDVPCNGDIGLCFNPLSATRAERTSAFGVQFASMRVSIHSRLREPRELPPTMVGLPSASFQSTLGYESRENFVHGYPFALVLFQSTLGYESRENLLRVAQFHAFAFQSTLGYESRENAFVFISGLGI